MPTCRCRSTVGLRRVRPLAPQHRDLRARLGGGGVDRGERDERVLVGEVAQVERHADGAPVPQHLVDLEERVPGLRHLDVLGRGPRLAQRADGQREVLGVPHQRHLDPVPGRLFPGRDAFQRLAAEEVMIEPDGAAVADVVRRHVVVGDVGGVHAAAQRAERGRVQPLPVPSHLRAEDGGHRRRDPARLEVRRGVGLGARPHEPELLAGGQDRAEHVLALRPRAEQLEAGLPGHAVAQRPHPVPGDRELGHVEELHVGQRPAGQLRHDRRRVRSLQLVAVQPGRRARRAVDRVVVPLDGDLVVTALRVELQPVDRPSGGPPHRTGRPQGGRGWRRR